MKKQVMFIIWIKLNSKIGYETFRFHTLLLISVFIFAVFLFKLAKFYKLVC